jgi:acetoin utilization deacetylase AcuC-like enzyme
MPVYFHPEFLKHRQMAFHPERPERLVRIMGLHDELRLGAEVKQAGPATDVQLLRVHEGSYLDMLRDFGEGPYDPDTYVRPETFGIARLAAGASIAAARDSVEARRPNIVLARPPGHHSGRNYAGGFCYLNNVAIAARALQAEDGVDRVAILDFDVHHGNGTSDVFYSDPHVLYISTHQWGIYPGTGLAEADGEGPGAGFNVNIPFLQGMGDATFKDAMDRIVRPIVTQFDPGAVLVSLGGDAHYADPLGGLTLSSKAFVETYLVAHELARDLGVGGATYFLEGGYNIDALAEVVWGVHEGFSSRTVPYRFNDVADAERMGTSIVDSVVQVQSKHWKL